MTQCRRREKKDFNYLRTKARNRIMAHHFYESRKIETAHFAAADTFYYNRLHAIKTERHNYSTPAGRQKQRADIDVTLTLKDGTLLTVSEKKRTRDFDDLYLEVFSKFPDVPGWTSGSQASFLAYFFPKRVFWAGFPQIRRFYRESLRPKLPDKIFSNLKNSHREKNAREEYPLKIAGVPYTVRLIQAYNVEDGNSWYTMGVSIPFGMLEDNHIRFQFFPCNGK